MRPDIHFTILQPVLSAQRFTQYRCRQIYARRCTKKSVLCFKNSFKVIDILSYDCGMHVISSHWPSCEQAHISTSLSNRTAIRGKWNPDISGRCSSRLLQETRHGIGQAVRLTSVEQNAITFVTAIFGCDQYAIYV